MNAIKTRRFLFLYSCTGGGHRAGARAVSAAMNASYGPRAAITLCDGLEASKRWPFNRFPKWWPAMVRFQGRPWRWFYECTNRPAIPTAMARLLLPYTAPPLQRLLAQNPAEVITSFHPLFTHTLAALLQRQPHAPPLASVVLDLVTIHAAWCAPTCARIFVPTAEAAARALAWGIQPTRVQCTGLPAHPRFAEAAQRDVVAVRTELGLPLEKPIVLIMGGGDAIGPFPALVRAVTLSCPQAHIVVIAGKNAALRQTLMQEQLRIQVEGFIENIELWMRAADVLLTKAGPNTLAEACIIGAPMVLYHAIPGQETGNVDWVVSHGAAWWAPKPQQAAAAVATLLADTQQRAQMRAAALRLARPSAAATIAAALWELAA